MTDSIESRGKTVDEAVSEALLRLGARRDEVAVEVLDEGKSGLLGFLGGRPARVVVTRKPAAGDRGGEKQDRPRTGAPREDRREGRRDDRRGGEPARPAREDQPREARQERAPREERGPREGSRGGRRGGRGRGGRGEERPEGGASRPPRGDAPAPTGGAPAPRPGREARPVERRTPDREPPPLDEPEVLGEEVRAVDIAKPVRGVPPDEVPDALERITGDVMRLSGFPCRIEVVPGEYHLVKVVTDDASAGVLIGRHGATIDALEHVVERMIGQAVGDRVNLNLDVNNYRRRRQEALVERARQLAQRVQQTGREIHMEPLCARERRVVHLEIASFTGLRTFTLGGLGGKHVVIAPEGMEEPAGATGPGAAAADEDDAYAADEARWPREPGPIQPEAGPPPVAGPDSETDERP